MLVKRRTIELAHPDGAETRGCTDGFALYDTRDSYGRDKTLIVSSCPGGLCVVDPSGSGKLLARLNTRNVVSNVAFGMDGYAYVTGRGGVWRIPYGNRTKEVEKQPTENVAEHEAVDDAEEGQIAAAAVTEANGAIADEATETMADEATNADVDTGGGAVQGATATGPPPPVSDKATALPMQKQEETPLVRPKKRNNNLLGLFGKRDDAEL